MITVTIYFENVTAITTGKRKALSEGKAKQHSKRRPTSWEYKLWRSNLNSIISSNKLTVTKKGIVRDAETNREERYFRVSGEKRSIDTVIEHLKDASLYLYQKNNAGDNSADRRHVMPYLGFN